MADSKHKSQAEKAVSAAKSKNTSAAKKATASKPAASKNPPAKGKDVASSAKKTPAKAPVQPEADQGIPPRFFSAVICLGLFIFFIVAVFKPEGALVKVINNVVLGLIGKVSFYISIFALLYLFCIHAFSGKRPVAGRTVCVLLFLLISGAISHISLDPQSLTRGFALVSQLYNGGITGTTGGLICGSFAMLLQWLCGTVISYILLMICGIFTLLGSMQITLPSIVRAIRNRPRPQWEEEDLLEEPPEPAAIVVNHIANKRIEHMEHQRQKKALREAEALQSLPEAAVVHSQDKVKDMLRQIEADVADPVSVASVAVSDDEEEIFAPVPQKVVKPEPEVVTIIPNPVAEESSYMEETIPRQMPEFKPEPPAPKVVKPSRRKRSPQRTRKNPLLWWQRRSRKRKPRNRQNTVSRPWIF